jgi:succinate dehydrogenase / fumarate reductase membrane anchor subunit
VSLGDSASPLGRVRGLGSAQHGGEHWLGERVTSIALLLLGTWLISSLLLLPKLDQRTVLEWLRAPSGAVPMALLIIIGFKHALDGVKVVIDDYVHEEGSRFAWHVLLFALARIAFGTVA